MYTLTVCVVNRGTVVLDDVYCICSGCRGNAVLTLDSEVVALGGAVRQLGPVIEVHAVC